MTGTTRGRADRDLSEVTAALDTLLEHGRDLLDDDQLAELSALRERIDERMARGDALTVVAVAGGTGVGKSALVNRLAGTPVADEGVRRPTTDHPVAVACAFDGPARSLLDHLEVHDRRVVDDGLPEGLVLIDLPDHDSVVVEHHRTAQRLTERVDALVVVVDPLKYARADLHDGPLARLSRHADVVTVALNRSDELSDDDVARCRADLAARLEGDGLPEVEIVTTSAATGDGTDELRARLGRLASARTAAARRLAADAARLADRIAIGTQAPPVAPDHVSEQLLEPLLDAADAGRASAEAAAAYRRDGRQGCRSPVARLVRAVPAGVASQLRATFSTAGPQPRPVNRSTIAIEAALTRHLHVTEVTGSAHAVWGRAIERISATAAPRLLDVVDAVPAAPRPRRWWPVLAGLRGLAETTALVGLVWLLLIGLADWLTLPEIPAPTLTDELSWPGALFVGGLVVRVLLGLASRVAIAAGARRHAARTGQQVRRELTDAVEAQVLAPVRAEVERRRTVCQQLERLGAVLGAAPERGARR